MLGIFDAAHRDAESYLSTGTDEYLDALGRRVKVTDLTSIFVFQRPIMAAGYGTLSRFTADYRALMIGHRRFNAGEEQLPEEDTMQRFNSPMTLEDRRVARRTVIFVVTIYASAAFALTAGVVAHVASNAIDLNNPMNAHAQIEAAGRTGHR